MEESKNPFERCLTDITLSGKTYRYYDFTKLNDPRIAKLPICIRILLECAIRNCDNYNVKEKDVESILNWKETSKTAVISSLFRLKSPSNHQESSCRISQVCLL